MEINLDPNFDQLFVICGIISVIVIVFILFVIKLPQEEKDDNTTNKSPKNCMRNENEDTEF
jgi:fucose permease